MSVSIRSVAKAANVSIATVSRALNSSKSVKSGTLLHVLKIALDMGYSSHIEISQYAKQLSYAKTSVKPSGNSLLKKVVSIVYYQTSQAEIYDMPYFRTVIDILHREFHKNGISVLESFPQTPEEYKKLFNSMHTDGTLVLGNIQKISEELLVWFQIHASNHPLVFVSNYPTGHAADFNFVAANNHKVGETAARYLIRQGIKDIHFLDFMSDKSVIHDRFCGYRQVMEENNIGVSSIAFDTEMWKLGKPMDVILPAFSHGKIGFVGSTDHTVLAFHEYLARTGHLNPERMVFVGCDGTPDLTSGDVRDATVQVDIEAIIRESLRLLNDIHNGVICKPTQIEVGCRLIEKKMVDPFNGKTCIPHIS